MELSKYLASNSTLNGRYDVNNATDDENYRDTVLENPIDSEPVPMQRGNSAIVYSYKLPRKVFACAAEDASLLHILKCAVSVRSGETSELVTCVDDTVVCGSCQINIKSLNSTSQQSRTVQLHTLHHGIITTTVVDFVCGSCGYCATFDGISDGVFCVTKKHIFSIELLEMWLWDICGTGGTF